MGIPDDLLVDLRDEFFQTGGLVGSLAVKHLIEYHSHRPNITLGGVGAAVENFRAHIHGASHEGLMNLIEFSAFLVILGESKICDFVGLVLDEDIGGLEVSVYDGVLVQVLIAADELFDDDDGLGLRQFLALFENILETALVAQLLEEVDVVGRLLHVIQLHDVLVLYRLHNLDLVLQRLVEFLGILLDVRSRDGLHRDEVTVSDVRALVDLPIGAAADLLVDVDDERLDELVVGSAQLRGLLLDLRYLALVDLIRHSIIQTHIHIHTLSAIIHPQKKTSTHHSLLCTLNWEHPGN